MYWVNGVVSETVAIADRGFQYGDGLFETLPVKGGRALLLDRHLRRLAKGCQRLAIPCPDLERLAFEVENLAQGCSEPAIVKIIITRGSGGRGYRPPAAVSPTRVVSLHPFPEYPESFQEQGIGVRFCSTRLGLNPALAGIKHLNRLEQVLARAEWNDPAIQEGLMLDPFGRVIEGTMTNLFYIRKQRLYTSPVNECGVAGIMREVILEWADVHKFDVIEQFFAPEALVAADEIFVCNSVIGLWPVRRLENRVLAVGSFTRQISRWLSLHLQHG